MNLGRRQIASVTRWQGWALITAGAVAAVAILCLLTSLSVASEMELVRDPHFRRGSTVSAPEPGRHVLAGVFCCDARGREPVWRVTQWSSRFPLEDFTVRSEPDG